MWKHRYIIRRIAIGTSLPLLEFREIIACNLVNALRALTTCRTYIFGVVLCPVIEQAQLVHAYKANPEVRSELQGISFIIGSAWVVHL